MAIWITVSVYIEGEKRRYVRGEKKMSKQLTPAPTASTVGKKMSKQLTLAPTASTVGPCHNIIQI